MGRADLSATRLSLLRECPRSYRERYVMGRKGRARPGMRRGSLVHLCLERAGKTRLGTVADYPVSGRDRPVELEELLSYLAHYTSRSDYPTTAVEEAREVLAVTAPLDLSRVAHVEEEWRISSRRGLSVTTKIDRVDLHDAYEEEGAEHGPTAIVVDYKTNGDVRNRADLRDDPQTLLYLAAARERYPAFAVGIVYHYLRREVKHAAIWWSPDLDAQARGAVEEALDELAKRSSGLDYFGEPDPDPWPGRAGSHCQWCGYKDGCDAYARLLASGDTLAPAPSVLSTPDLLAEYARARDAVTLNEDRKKDCGLELRDRIGQGREVVSGTLRGSLVTPTKNYLDPMAAAQAVAAHAAAGDFETADAILPLITSTDLDTKKLKAYLEEAFDPKTRSKIMKEIENSKVPVDGSSYVKVSDYRDPFAVGENPEEA